MAEPDSSAADLQETLTNKKEEEEKDVPELEKEEEEEVDRSLQKCENPSDMETGALTLPEEEEEEDSEKTLADADELMEKGSKATKEGDYAEAVDCFSRAVEIRLGFLVFELLISVFYSPEFRTSVFFYVNDVRMRGFVFGIEMFLHVDLV